MACIRKRRGKWVVDHRDAAGIRRWVTCETRKDAEAVLSDRLRSARQPTRPLVDPSITVAAYSARWLGVVGATSKRRTLETYQGALRLHILPTLGGCRVAQLHRGQLKVFFAEKRGTLSRNYVKLILGVLRAMLGGAVDDGVIAANPADKLGRQLRLGHTRAARQEHIKAMTREQVAHFLATAERVARRYFPLFLAMARMGLRVGEALAVQWADLDFAGREARIERAFSAGRLEDTPKGNHGRTVDMSQQLTRLLQRLEVERKAETLRRGWRDVPPWVFCSEAGEPLTARSVDRLFKRVLKAAGLPGHFTPHGLRHSYASLLLQAGVSPVYVQRQLGHTSIQMTVDLYGRWLPMGNKAAVDSLDGASGSKTVAAAVEPGETRDLPRVATAGPRSP